MRRCEELAGIARRALPTAGGLPLAPDNSWRSSSTGCPLWHHDAMANIEKISVALDSDMIAEVRAAVEQGDYGSVSEVVRDALRDWRLRRRIEGLETDELRRLVREGMNSGASLDADGGFARLRARFGQPPAE
jgi:antitoxin ParD1/3/4